MVNAATIPSFGKELGLGIGSEPPVFEQMVRFVESVAVFLELAADAHQPERISN